jgi:hypothetical protein
MGDRTDAQQRWMPQSILVFAGEGRPPIDIAKCLVDDQDELGSLVNKKKVIKFPVDVYPPRFDDRNVIESAVKIAVSEADNINLTLFATAPRTHIHVRRWRVTWPIHIVFPKTVRPKFKRTSTKIERTFRASRKTALDRTA